jgi:hypothetical protein
MNSTAELEARISALEPAYHSAGEAQIGRALDRYGVPFLYEQPVVILDRGRYEVWHPAFTLTEQNGVVIEYAGTAESAAAIKQKEQAYRANGVSALVVYPEDLTRPAWPQSLYERIEKASEQVQEPWPNPGAPYQAAQSYRYG